MNAVSQAEGSSSSRIEVKDRKTTAISSMRPKSEHLKELEAAYATIQDALQRIRRTRTNVPFGSHVHKRLKEHEDSLFEIRGEVWFSFQTLAQNGYGEAA